METVSNPSDFYEKYGQTFKTAYRSAYQQVMAREEAKRSSFQLKDWVFLSANLANFMPTIDSKNYEAIYHKLLTNHLLSGTSFNYIDFDSMKYMRIEGNTEFLKPESAKIARYPPR